MGDKATKVIPLASTRRILTVSAAWKTWGGDERWTQDDIAWFSKHPQRSYRLRVAFAGETIRALASTDDITLDDSFQVVVREEDTTTHVRVAANFDTTFDADDEDMLSVVFETLQHGVTSSDIALLAKHGNNSILGPRTMMANILHFKGKHPDKELVEKEIGGETVLDFQRKVAAPLVIELAIKLWGEPTAHNGNEYKFGSKSVNARTGMWFDFEADTGGNIRDLIKLKSSARAKSRVIVKATPFKWIDPTKIPRREWLYGPHYIREFLSLLFATGGKGKSSLLIAEALAMVSGKTLLNVVPKKRLRVWYWNGEDPELELKRRFAAAIKHYGLKPEDIGDRLFIDSGRKLPIVIAEAGEYGGVYICEPVIQDIVTTLQDNQIDVLIIDPFISCHRVSENDNPAIERVAKSWAHIAEELHCSIMAAHHTRKSGNEVATVDDGRGASAPKDASRAARTINPLTDNAAEIAEISPREQRYYFRADKGKGSMIPPPAEVADWYKLVSVDLQNGIGDGDQVGVVTAFIYPVAEDILPRITTASIAAAQSAIKAGGPWRYDLRSKKEPWVGIPIAGALGVSLQNKLRRQAIVGLINDWITAGTLKRVSGHDARYEVRDYIEAGTAPLDPVVRPTTGGETY